VKSKVATVSASSGIFRDYDYIEFIKYFQASYPQQHR